MKALINKVFECLVILTLILILGTFVPFIVASVVAIVTDYTLDECIANPGFAIITFITCCISFVYIKELIHKGILKK